MTGIKALILGDSMMRGVKQARCITISKTDLESLLGCSIDSYKECEIGSMESEGKHEGPPIHPYRALCELPVKRLQERMARVSPVRVGEYKSGEIWEGEERVIYLYLGKADGKDMVYILGGDTMHGGEVLGENIWKRGVTFSKLLFKP